MDTPQWPQGIGVMEGGGNGTTRRARPQKDQALNCPRCNSTNTKFCYYNNYSLSQPRYFCKTCRRYWTEGGSLRNVPVGGGSRKNKRATPPSSSSSANSSKIKLIHDHHHPQLAPPPSFLHSSSQNPNKIQYQGQDLNLAYPPSTDHHHPHHQDYMNSSISKFVIEMPPYMNSNSTDHPHDQNPSTTTTTTTTTTSPTSAAMELFKSTTGIGLRGGLMSSFMSMPVSDSSTIYSNGFNNPLQEFKPAAAALNFTLDGLESGGYGSGLQETNNNARLLFPFEDSSRLQVSNSTDHHHNEFEQSRGQGDATGYWSGMLGGGGGGEGGGGGGSW